MAPSIWLELSFHRETDTGPPFQIRHLPQRTAESDTNLPSACDPALGHTIEPANPGGRTPAKIRPEAYKNTYGAEHNAQWDTPRFLRNADDIDGTGIFGNQVTSLTRLQKKPESPPVRKPGFSTISRSRINSFGTRMRTVPLVPSRLK